MHFFANHRRRFHRDDPSPGGPRGPRGHHPHDHHAESHADRHGRHRGDGPRGESRHGDERRRGGRSDLGRFFAHGDLRLVILQLIAEKPRHGYEIIRAIEERVAGAYSPSPGVVYPTLTLLEELGHVTVTPGEGTKKLHGITPEGLAVLEGNRAAVDALLARMAEAAEAFGDGPAPSVVRARENLKLALKLRLARGPLTAEQSAAVAAALDAASVAVERS